MSCSMHECRCPQCQGLVDVSQPALQDLKWGLAAARMIAADGFWAPAVAGDLYDRGGHANTNDDLDSWVRRIRRDASTLANLTAVPPGMVARDEGLEMSLPEFKGWGIPEDWQSDYVQIDYLGPPPPPEPPPEQEDEERRCCPTGPPVIKSKAHGRQTRVRETTCGMFWDVEVTATFQESDECSCDCCELRLYVNYRDQTGAAPIQSTDQLLTQQISDGQGGTEPLYTGPARNGMTSPQHFPGLVYYPQKYYHDGEFTTVTYIEDMSFGPNDLQPSDVVDSVQRSDLMSEVNRYGDRSDATTFSSDGCTVTLYDHPRLVLRAGQRGRMIRLYKAVIRTRPHCRGDTARETAYTLMGTAYCARSDSAADAEMSTLLGDHYTPWPDANGWRSFRGNQHPEP